MTMTMRMGMTITTMAADSLSSHLADGSGHFSNNKIPTETE
jgi:hypothetical protein